MSSLKQKISKLETKTRYSLCQKECIHTSEDCKRCRKTTLVRKDKVLGLLDETTKELLNLAIHGLKEAQNGESSDCTSTFATIIEKLGIHVEYDEWHEPIIDAKQVKAVLEGAEQK